MKKKYIGGAIAFLLACVAIFAASYGYLGANKVVDDADRELVAAEPLESTARKAVKKDGVVYQNEADAVSEKIAGSLIRQLGGWGGKAREMVDGLRECSAIHASKMQGDKSKCFTGYPGGVEEGCLVKRGFGRKSTGQILSADRFDLNADGVADYIISDRYYCEGLSSNQASVYFVMLSAPKGEFRLAYADWASYGLQVIKDPAKGNLVLIERARKISETHTTVLQLEKEKFVPRVCIFEDKNGYSRCD